MKQIVAIPMFEHGVAPCFEVANQFMISVLEDGELTSSRAIGCRGCEGFGRVRLLRDKNVQMLVCDGIKGFYRDLLGASGIEVISGVTLSIEEVLRELAVGSLNGVTDDPLTEEESPDIPLEDLICWARELFEAHGYKTTPGAERAPFPIDLIAEISCPLCKRPVRVAICCGAHAYRTDQELREFSRVSATDYHARVYVRPASSSVKQCCFDYGIDLIDPDKESTVHRRIAKGRIPLLLGTVVGHEKASRSSGDDRRHMS